MGKAWAVGQKSLVDHQQSAKNCHQLPLRLSGQYTLSHLPRKDRQWAILWAIPGKVGCPNNKKSIQKWFRDRLLIFTSTKQSLLHF